MHIYNIHVSVVLSTYANRNTHTCTYRRTHTQTYTPTTTLIFIYMYIYKHTLYIYVFMYVCMLMYIYISSNYRSISNCAISMEDYKEKVDSRKFTCQYADWVSHATGCRRVSNEILIKIS